MAEIEIDRVTKDALQTLADMAGLPLADYLALMAEEKKREHALEAGAGTFRRVTSDPATVAAFDAEFGGPTPVKHAPRAA